MLRARLFGTLTLDDDGAPRSPPTSSVARSVLSWLLLHPGLHAREHVAARFWPEVVDRRARASLRTALWELRRATSPSRWIAATREHVGMPADLPRWIDVEEFERRLEAGGDDDLAAAVDLARHPLLTDLGDAWVLERRDALIDRSVAAALELARRAEARGDGPAALSWTRRAAERGPLDERAHRLLMRRLAAANERAQALMAYDRLEASLLAEAGTAPSAPTRALADELRRGGEPAARAAVVEESGLCRAPAVEVWKLLQDPLRYPEWWDGVTEVSPSADGVTRWMGALPGVPIPTRIELRRAPGAIVLRCEVTGIVHVWTLEPAPGGCRVRLRAAVPADATDRWLDQQRGEAHASLPRLIRAAERAATEA